MCSAAVCLCANPSLLQSQAVESLLVVGALVVASVLVWYLSGRLRARFEYTTVEVARAIMLLAGLAAALLVVMWDATGQVVSTVALFEFSFQTEILLLFTVVLLIAAYATTRSVKRLLLGERSATSRVTTDHQLRIVFYTGQVVIYVVALFGVLSLWGVRVSDLLVGAGVLGIVLGFAAQETLASILAGFILMLFARSMSATGYSSASTRGSSPTSPSTTVRLRSFDGEYVVIPNETVSNSVIVNRSREGKLRLRVEVGIDYEADPERAEAVALEALLELDEIMGQPAPQVLPVRFGESAVVLELRFCLSVRPD